MINFDDQYTPSWVDYLTGWVSKLPGQSLLFYAGLAVLLLLIQGIGLYQDGLLVHPGINRAQIFLSLAIPYTLVLIDFFDRRAKVCLGELRPSLEIDDEDFQKLEYILTTMPALKTFGAGFLGIGCVFLLESISGSPYQLEHLHSTALSGIIFRIAYMLLWWVFGTLVYHTFHQLSVIGKIYSQLVTVNLSQPRNLYIFSNLIAMTAFFTALLPVGFLIANPWASWNDPVVFGTVLVVQLLALGVFVWPHYGIHRLQVAEKERMLGEVNQRLEKISRVLHQGVDENTLERAGDVNTTISSLIAELSVIQKIPTWPWQPETLRILITALAFPLGVWLIQVLLGNYLAR